MLAFAAAGFMEPTQSIVDEYASRVITSVDELYYGVLGMLKSLTGKSRSLERVKKDV